MWVIVLLFSVKHNVIIIKASNSYNLFRSSITKDNYVKSSMFCKKLGIKNPLKAIVIVPKNNINIYGRYQPTLF